ncbi:MAG: nucleoside 2-deoxyribosyltransferase [Lentisphaeria bacterium]|nr:nucleoside 2-deoxyribosyltransferase [Lentisphaeria bacterium]
MAERALKVYWAGDLFDAKDLGGNLLLAQAVEEVSGGRYQVCLPQQAECGAGQRLSRTIRDADFELLFNCDMILANFDGPDPDSGTVVEFCFAKMVDMPAVLLRTDFRKGGDHILPDDAPWNLMCSHYPRTALLLINAMERYLTFCGSPLRDAAAQLSACYRSIAADVVKQLDAAAGMTPWLNPEQVLDQYRRTVKSIGGDLETRLDEPVLQALAASKIAAGIY